MRILAGYLTATSGQASIAGLDVFWNSVEVRRKIGYMPESCPLYTDMHVSEYLKFRAGIKGIYGSQRRQRRRTTSSSAAGSKMSAGRSSAPSRRAIASASAWPTPCLPIRRC